MKYLRLVVVKLRFTCSFLRNEMSRRRRFLASVSAKICHFMVRLRRGCTVKNPSEHHRSISLKHFPSLCSGYFIAWLLHLIPSILYPIRVWSIVSFDVHGPSKYLVRRKYFVLNILPKTLHASVLKLEKNIPRRKIWIFLIATKKDKLFFFHILQIFSPMAHIEFD